MASGLGVLQRFFTPPPWARAYCRQFHRTGPANGLKSGEYDPIWRIRYCFAPTTDREPSFTISTFSLDRA